MDKSGLVYDYIKSYISDFGYPPTVRDLCKGVGFSSTSTAQYYLNKLSKQGLISFGGSKNRAITLTEEKHFANFVPEIGTVTAGIPILAVENLVGYCPVAEDFGSVENVFALKVKGLSMKNAGILDGDKIIVKQTSDCFDGDIVVALLNDSATVKRFYKRNGKFVLHPENEDFEDIIVDDLSIIGKVIGLIRKY